MLPLGCDQKSMTYLKRKKRNWFSKWFMVYVLNDLVVKKINQFLRKLSQMCVI